MMVDGVQKVTLHTTDDELTVYLAADNPQDAAGKLDPYLGSDVMVSGPDIDHNVGARAIWQQRLWAARDTEQKARNDADRATQFLRQIDEQVAEAGNGSA